MAEVAVVPSARRSDSVSLVIEIFRSPTPGIFSRAVRMVAAQLPQSMPTTFQLNGAPAAAADEAWLW